MASSSYAVFTTFGMKDKMSKGFKKMGKSAAGFGSTLKAILSAGIIQRGFQFIASGISEVTQEFKNYDNAITQATAKFAGLDSSTKQGQETLKELEKTARDVGAATQFTASQAAEGLDFLAMAGFTATEAIKGLPGITDLATVANTDFARATDIASDSLGAFGLDVDDLTKLNDVFAKTMTTSNTDMENLFEAVKKGAPTFTAAGQSLESFNALAGIMANSGVKGAEAGTQLRNVMLRLSKPTKEAQGVLNKLNIQTQDSKGNFLDVTTILGQFEKATKNMGTAQKSAALNTVFGARAITGVNILLATGEKKMKAYRKQLEDSSGAAAKMAEVIRSSLENRLAALKSTAIEIGFKFIDLFKNKIGKGIDFITKLLRKIDFEKIFKTGIAIFNKFYKVIKPIIKAIFELGKTLFNLGQEIFKVVQEVGIFNFIFGVAQNVAGFVSDAVRGLAKVINFLIPVLKIIIPIIGAWIAVQTILNLVMSLNPISLIIIGISALVAAVLWLIENFNKVVEAVKNIWRWFLKLLDNPFIAAAGAIFAPFITIPALIIKHWEPIKQFFINLWENVLKPIFDAVVGIAQNIGGFFGDIGKGIGDFFGGVGEFFTGGGEKTEAPNQREIEARQQINFEGNLNINGAPPGSSFEQKMTGAPPLDYALLGAS